MIVCDACGGAVPATARACPNCGLPSAARRQTLATPGGWFSFAGRITRRQYWLLYTLPIGILDGIGEVLDIAVQAGGVMTLVVTFLTFIASLAGASKRLHDRGRSGWFQLIVLVPILGVIWLAVELMFLRGTRGPNRFGPDPLAPARIESVIASG